MYYIIWTENNDVIDSFISEILKYESSVIQSLTEKPPAVLFTPLAISTTIANTYAHRPGYLCSTNPIDY